MSVPSFSQRVPIGRVNVGGQPADVIMTAEFSRAIVDVFNRLNALESPLSPAVTGSVGGNAALASLIAALASAGIIKNQTTA